MAYFWGIFFASMGGGGGQNDFHCSASPALFSGSEKGVFWQRALFRKVHFLEILEFRDSRDFREPPHCGKQRRIRRFSRDSRELRDFRDSRDSSSEKTPFVMTPFSSPALFHSFASPAISNPISKLFPNENLQAWPC